MSIENGGIRIISVINPCLYGIAASDSSGHSLVGLYGIVPPELNTFPGISSKNLTVILEHWRNYNTHIRELLSTALRVHFEQECIVDGIAFGKLTVFGSNGQLDLKEFLIQTTIGAASTNPIQDALVIKTNSWKPDDFNFSSLSSSDEASTSTIEDKRKLKTRSTCLKKPFPLALDRPSSNNTGQNLSEFSITSRDQSIVRAILRNQAIPAEFVKRYSAPPPSELSSSSPTVAKDYLPKVVSKTPKPIDFLKINAFLAKDENEISGDYLKLKEEWIESLACKQTGLVKKKPLLESEVMSTLSPPSNSSTTSPPISQGRGKLLSMAQGLLPSGEDKQVLGDSETVRTPAAIGRGYYLKSSVSAARRGVGRAQQLKELMEVSAFQSCFNSELSKPKKVFSLDAFGGFPRATINEDNSPSESHYPPSVINRNAESNSVNVSSSTSMESLKSINNSQTAATTSQPSPSVSDAEQYESSASISNKPVDPEEIRSDIPLNEYLKRILAFGGLTHGKNALPPINDFTESSMHPLIIENLKNQYVSDLPRTQAYSIPNILNRKNVVIISSSRTGKTIASVIPLAALLCEKEFYSSLKEGCGPRAVFITSCAQTVNHVAEAIKKIAPHLMAIGTYGGGSELEKTGTLVNGCDVLVSTPRCWLRLLNYKWVTSPSRLCHLFIDDMDTVINLYKPELLEILKVLDFVKSKRAAGPEPQLVLVSETWNQVLNDIVTTRISEPIICFTSFLEAALYTHIRPTVHIISPLSKVEKLIELLKGKDHIPSIIVCDKSEEVCFLRSLLYTRRTNVMVSHGNMIFSMKRDIHVNWQNSINSKISPPLLIASDDALSDLGINNAQWLLHYSLPLSKTVFDYRFSTIKSYFIDRLSNPEALLLPDCKVDILVDHTVEHQLPDIVSFMTRLKASVPEEILVAVEKINKNKEINKSNDVALCENLLEFGNCWKKSKCREQHCIVYDRDKPRNIPLNGFVRFQVLQVHSPTHFSVRLISHTEDVKISPDSWTTWPSEYIGLAMHLNRYYSNRANRRMHGDVQVGDLAGVEIEVDSIYLRVKVLDIIERDERHNAKKIRVRFIDEGTRANMEAFKLLHLPNELRTYSRTSVDLFLTELLPVDLDRSWSYVSTSMVKKKLFSLPDNYILVAKISFVLGYSILAESVKAIENLNISKCNVVHLSLKNYLLEKNIAVKNPEHLVPLIQLCQEANIPICGSLPCIDSLKQPKKISSQKKFMKNQNSLMWAHLPKDEMSTVILSSADDPSWFYVCHEKFRPILERLEKDIGDFVGTNPNHVEMSEISAYFVCLAKYENRWNRAMLCEEPSQNNKKTGELTYPIRFLDYGDVAYVPITDLVHCPDKFLSTLPFQAIKCGMVGVSPLNGELWSEEAGDVLYELTQTTEENGQRIFKSLSIFVTSVIDEGHQLKSGKHYKVILYDSVNGNDMVLNKEMVLRGYANWKSEEKHLLDEKNPSKGGQANESIAEDENLSETTFEESQDDTSYSDKTDNQANVNNEGMTDKQLIEIMDNLDIQVPSSESSSTIKFLAYLQNSVLMKAGKKKASEITEVKKKSPKQTKSTKVLMESENDGDVSESEDSQISNLNLAELNFKSGLFTPKTAWFQTFAFVYVRILLPGIEQYSLKWSETDIDFGATYDGKQYCLYIDLFGQICPDKFDHIAKGQYLEIKMLKLMTDINWPRLLYDEVEKPFWLQVLDETNANEDDHLDSHVNLGELSCKYFKKEATRFEGKIWHYDREDCDSSLSDAEEEVYNPDPFDPLQ